MTIVVAVACPDYVVQVSDRRLSDACAPRSVRSEEENKAIYWCLPSARLAVGYTGLGEVCGMPMHRHLCVLLGACQPTAVYQPGASVEALRQGLTDSFDRREVRRLRAQDRRLSVMVTGILDSEDARPILVNAMLTNFQGWENNRDSPTPWDHFTARYCRQREGEEWPTLVQRIGNYHALPIGVEERIRALVTPGRPARAVVDKIVALMRTWSTPTSGIGPQANSLIIPMSPVASESWGYHSADNSWTWHGGDTVVSSPGNDVILTDFQFQAVQGPSCSVPVVVPPVARRRPCPLRQR